MTLKEFIENVGTRKVAEIIEVNYETVRLWKLLESAPKPEIAYLLIERSKGILDWESIYLEYCTKKLSIENPAQLKIEV